jgi:AraC-like DNA-binding protein
MQPPSTQRNEHIERDTVSMYFVNAAVRRLDALARQRVLAAAGIPEALLLSPNARVLAPSFSALWLAVARELDDEFFGLDHRRMNVGSFALLCQAVAACQKLDRALKRMLRGFSLFFDDVRAELSVVGSAAELRVINQIADPLSRQFADETFLVLVHGLLCWLAGRQVELHRVDFAYERPAHAGEYTVMYSQHVKFNAPFTAMHFDAQVLSSLVSQSTSTLSEFLRTAPQSVFLKYKNQGSWTARLRRRLRDCAGTDAWPVLPDLAAELHTTPTTLRRRLEAEGTSYQRIKDQLRNDLAIDRLCNSALSIEEIGAELGFHDASVFHRAFKRWNGLQPGEYRRRQSDVNDK